MKTEVYSWRVSEDLKSDIEREARLRKVSVSAVLETAVRDLLNKSGSDPSDEEGQRALHKSVSRYLGVLSSGNTRRAERASQIVRERLGKRYGR